MKKWYMKVTLDDYQLPLVVAESLDELSEKTGLKINSIRSMIAKGKKQKHASIVEIPFTEEELENEEL